MFHQWRPLPIFSPSSFPIFRSQSSFAASPNLFFQFIPDPPFIHSLPQEIPRSVFSHISSPQTLKPLRVSLCFRCGGNGHTARSCLLPIRCFNCGASGHKRLKCLRCKILKPNPLKTKARGEDQCKSAQVLLDPEVANCLVKTIPEPLGHLPSSGASEGMQLMPDVFRSGAYVFGKTSLAEKGLDVYWVSFIRRKLLHCNKLGLRKRCGASYSPKVSAKLGSSFGRFSNLLAAPKLSCWIKDSRISPQWTSSLVKLPCLKICNNAAESAIEKELGSSDLHPAQREVISAFGILDDFEGLHSGEEEDLFISPHHTSSKSHYPLKLEPVKKKVPLSVKIQDAALPVPVRRSPRLLGK